MIRKRTIKSYKQYLKEMINVSDLIPEKLLDYCTREGFNNQTRGNINYLIDSAKLIFKHRDKHFIVFLKFMRYFLLQYVIQQYKTNPEDFEQDNLEVKAYIANYENAWRTRINKDVDIEDINDVIRDIDDTLDEFRGAYSTTNPDIENYNPPPNTSVYEMLKLFDQFMKKHEGEVIIKFPNGWAWFDLKRPACRKEGKAMEHCGNSPEAGDDNQTIFSLRSPRQDDGTITWESHLTFIYWKRQKSLGQMKGRSNTKPDKRYHEYIIKLLEHPLIQQIHGGGHLPENNFSIFDLNERVYNTLLDDKPNLASPQDRFNHGLYDEVEFYNEFLRNWPKSGDDIVISDEIPWVDNILNSLKEFAYNKALTDRYSNHIYENSFSDNLLEDIQDYLDKTYGWTHISRDATELMDNFTELAARTGDPILRKIEEFVQEDINSANLSKYKDMLNDLVSDYCTIRTYNSNDLGGVVKLDITNDLIYGKVSINDIMEEYGNIGLDDAYTYTKDDLRSIFISYHDKIYSIDKSFHLDYILSNKCLDKIDVLFNTEKYVDKVNFLSRQQDMFGDDNLNHWRGKI